MDIFKSQKYHWAKSWQVKLNYIKHLLKAITIPEHIIPLVQKNDIYPWLKCIFTCPSYRNHMHSVDTTQLIPDWNSKCLLCPVSTDTDYLGITDKLKTTEIF